MIMSKEIYEPCNFCNNKSKQSCDNCRVALNKKSLDTLSSQLLNQNKELATLQYEYKNKINSILTKILTTAHRNGWIEDNQLICKVNAIDEVVRKLKEEIC